MTSTQPHNDPNTILAALAVVVRGDHVLLVRRRNPPDEGLWGFPGGKVDKTETPCEAAVRELFEETNVTAISVETLTRLSVRNHPNNPDCEEVYDLVAVRCAWCTGEPIAGDDALEASWLPVQAVLANEFSQSRDVDSVLKMALPRSLSVQPD